LKHITAQIVVKRDHSVLFKTESMPIYQAEKVYEELMDKFKISIYKVDIIKTTVYTGYCKLENLHKQRGRDMPF